MKLAATMRPDQHLLVNLSAAAATRTSAPWPTCRAPSSSAGPRAVAEASRAGKHGRGAAMSRIAATLCALKAQGRKALIPYVTAGDPFADATPDIMHGAGGRGADIIELGVPVQRPDGRRPGDPEGRERALARGIGWCRCWRGAQLPQRDTQTPVVLMGYANPIERYDRHGWQRLRAAPRPASTACWWWTTRPRSARRSPRPCRPPAWTRSSCWRPRPPTSASRGGPPAARLRVLRVAQGRDGCGHLDADAVAEVFPRIRRHMSACPSASDSASATRPRQEPSRAWPMRW
jgi:tryptophan synthase alpha chain